MGRAADRIARDSRDFHIEEDFGMRAVSSFLPKVLVLGIAIVVCAGLCLIDGSAGASDKTPSPGKTLTLEIGDEELQRRRREWKTPEPKIKEGYLSRYAKMVTSASTGAVCI